MLDVLQWYMAIDAIDGICPNCGTDIAVQFPEFNVWPHFVGDCIYSPEQRARVNSLLRMGL